MVAKVVHPRHLRLFFRKTILLKEGLDKVESYPNPCKDERHVEPGLSGDGQLSFYLQVIAEIDTEEHDTQCHEHDSN